MGGLMGWMQDLFRPKPKNLIISATDLVASGVLINPLQVGPLWSAVKFLSDAISSIPLDVFEAGSDRKKATKSDAYRLIKIKPNNFQCPVTFMQSVVVSMLLRGKAYLYKVKDGDKVTALIPLNPDLVQVELKGYKKYFRVGNAGDPARKEYTENEIIHLIHFTQDGVNGLSPIEYFSDTLGLGNSLKRFAKKYFTNSASLGGVMNLPAGTTEADYERAKAQFANFTNVENAGKIPFLPDGYKYTPLSISAKDALIIESLNFNLQDIARIYNIPSNFLGDTNFKTSYASIEALGIELKTFTLLPLARKIESALNSNLFPDGELYVEFNFSGFARGTMAERMGAYNIGLNAGFLTPNEVRKYENLPPLEGGDKLRIPLNMGLAEDQGKSKNRIRPVDAVDLQKELDL